MDTCCAPASSLKDAALTSAGGLGEAEPKVVVAIVRPVPVEVRDARIPRIIVPRATTNHAVAASGQLPFSRPTTTALCSG